MPITGPIPLPETGIDAFQNAYSQSIKDRLMNAQAQRAQAMAQLPFGGQRVPGPAGQVVGLEMVRRMYGDNSPQYQQAKKSYDLSQSSIGSRINYQNKLTDTMPLRYTTPLGRETIETSNVASGNSPTGSPAGKPVIPGGPNYDPNAVANATSPDQSNGQSNQQNQQPNQGGITPTALYGHKLIKGTIPNFVLQKESYANNVNQTIDSVDADAFNQYNGPKGQKELAQEWLNVAMGNPASEKYQKYLDAVNQYNLLPMQIGKFYGDSISPGAAKARSEKFDTRSWNTNPDIGKNLWQKQSELLRKEMQTYQDRIKDPSSYLVPVGKSNNSNQGTNQPVSTTQNQTSNNENDTQGKEPPPGTKWMIRPDNVKVAVHDTNVEYAKSKLKYKEVE